MRSYLDARHRDRRDVMMDFWIALLAFALGFVVGAETLFQIMN